MLFSSWSFILLFLPLFLLFWQVIAIWRPGLLPLYLLGMSLFFYSLWGLPFLLLLVCVISLNWGLGKWLAASSPAAKERRRVLTLAIILNLLPLLWFKYSWFLVSSVATLFGASVEFSPPGLPLGISFYTFIQIAWLCAVARGEAQPQSYLRHLLFSGCFLYVMSGPITRAPDILPQFESLSVLASEGLARGVTLFVIGLAKKVLLADNLAIYANAVFGAADKGWPLTTPEAWLGSFCYSLQLYFDFSGYTDMALGIGLIIGLRLPQNFNSPYKTTGIVEFWRCWHITLGRWLRDYLYIPLGGNRKGRLRQYVNLFLTMLIGGAWHGAGWTYIAWGAMHGTMLAINHYFRASIKGRDIENFLKKVPVRIFFILFTFLCLNFCWVIFRAPSLDCALAVYYPMFNPVFAPDYWPLNALSGWDRLFGEWLCNGYFNGPGLALLAAGFLLVWAFPNSGQILEGKSRLAFRPGKVWAAGTACALFASLLFLGRKSVFLYFQF